jgi:hypothetical protein
MGFNDGWKRPEFSDVLRLLEKDGTEPFLGIPANKKDKSK